MRPIHVVPRRLFLRSTAATAALGLVERTKASAEPELRKDALAAMKKAATYFRSKVARHGGYVYYYSPDLTRRLGEGVAGPEEIWVQPPGTPSVGLAYLAAFEATGDQLYLDAALEAGRALIYGQLQSGGWTASIDFDPRGPRVGQYRSGKGRGRNNSTLDDGISQGAIRFLARLDKALDFKNEKVHEAVQVALDALLAAQFANGAFPQVWTGPVSKQPVIKASYPSYDWRSEGKVKNYWDMYTLNDGLAGTVTATLLDVHAVYDRPKYREAAARLGDFLILAQMPDPQPAWAQQYSYAMHPIWARRFEPAAITGGESQDVMETLITIFRTTVERKYLEPIPRALAYLKKSLLPDGRLARYYELQTNQPLYMTRRSDEYSLTYDDQNLPDHYGWKVESRLEAIEADFQRGRSGDRGQGTGDVKHVSSADAVRMVIAALDDQGRWISTYAGERLVGQPKFKPGEKYISSAVFSQHLQTLRGYVAAGR
ncbi:MAG: pectic acid lyase [Planctomycetaceae bacterium]|nr:pectic acid lyase [Planctomycetaceae bacterium]